MLVRRRVIVVSLPILITSHGSRDNLKTWHIAWQILYPPMSSWKRCRSNGRRTDALSHLRETVFARTRDHCHLIDRYRDPAHSNCNLNYKNSFYIPIIFHNLSGYDTHLYILKKLLVYDENADLLSITKEKYISFTKHVDQR